MSSNRPVTASVSLLAALILAAAVVLARSAPSGVPAQARGAIEEAQEQRETTEQRLVALESARQAGTLGVTERITSAPATGWAGEEIVNDSGDDWEPAIAADPNAPYVYIMHNRYGTSPCQGPCPDPAMVLHVSKDGGKTWAPERFLCECRNINGQWDPLLEVVPETGDVYAMWMNNYKISFSKSSDHGRTWTEPLWVHPDVRWGDKPNFGTSADGRDVYMLFNGPSVGDLYASSSHDAGETWSTVRITDDIRYWFAYGTAVLPNGRVLSSQVTFSYTGQAGAAEGPVDIRLYTSDDGGATWSESILDELELGTPCTSTLCYADFYDSGPALAMDEDGDLVIVYSGAAKPGGPRTVYARSSTNGGKTWSPRTRLSPEGANAAFAAAAGVGNDGVRVYFADERTGRWNVWYRSSNNLGSSWTTAVKISDATSGTNYKNAKGFREFYGDYGEIAVTSTGEAIGVWGEGPSYLGPGGVWFNRQT